MKLDPRIIEGKKPLGCFETEEAKKFIRKECYFADNECCFQSLDFEQWSSAGKGILENVSDIGSNAYRSCRNWYAYCLPCEWVQEQKEPEWRPFSLTEWRHEYAIGDEIVFRIKNSNTVRAFMFCGLFSDHDDDLPGKGVINLGGELFVLQNLFEKFELRKDNEWQPFGVIDEDKE